MNNVMTQLPNGEARTDTPTPTYGAKAVGYSFNPSGDDKVARVKGLYAQIIDLCNDLRTEAGHGEQGRLLSVAITEAQTAQMRAVKGITRKD